MKDFEDVVEYDADSDDEDFLRSLNADAKTTPKRKTANQKLKTVSSPVHIDQFEKIMDALEKAAYQQVYLLPFATFVRMRQMADVLSTWLSSRR